MNKNVKKFISDTVEICLKNNVTFNLVAKQKVLLSKGQYCSGFFSVNGKDVRLTTAVGEKAENWLAVLVHESCHLDQYLEDKTAFVEEDESWLIWDWIDGKNISKEEVKRGIELCKKLELDCEKRSVQKIAKYNLPIDITIYIQKSNLYMYFYNWVLKNRKWIKKGDTLYKKELYSLCKTNFLSNYNTTPKELNDLMDKLLQ